MSSPLCVVVQSIAATAVICVSFIEAHQISWLTACDLILQPRPGVCTSFKGQFKCPPPPLVLKILFRVEKSWAGRFCGTLFVVCLSTPLFYAEETPEKISSNSQMSLNVLANSLAPATIILTCSTTSQLLLREVWRHRLFSSQGRHQSNNSRFFEAKSERFSVEQRLV